MALAKRFRCVTCGRNYRLKQEQADGELLCFHCGSTLALIDAAASSDGAMTAMVEDLPTLGKLDGQQPLDRAKPQGFNTLVHLLALQMPPAELGILQGMHHEGAIDTGWLKRNYSPQIGGDTAALIMSESPAAYSSKLPDVILGCYRVAEKIGEGCMGIVYRGCHIGNGESVAIKRLHPDRLAENQARARFLREVHFLKSLSHQHILPLLAGGEEAGEYWLVTPFVAGGSLEKLLKQIPPDYRLEDIAPLLTIVAKIAEALDYAHQKHLVHRDVKPGNILLTADGHPYLGDFGLAKQTDTNAPSLTQGAVGTPYYMAPELWQKQSLPQSDIYSVGVILYEIVAGEYPFSGNCAEQILVQQLSTSPKIPGLAHPCVPKRLNDLILKAIARHPQHRYDSAKQLATELRAVATPDD